RHLGPKERRSSTTSTSAKTSGGPSCDSRTDSGPRSSCTTTGTCPSRKRRRSCDAGRVRTGRPSHEGCARSATTWWESSMRNDLYDLEQELRDLIERKFEEATGGATDVARGVTRARRRIARNAVAATLVIALFGYGAIAGFRALP